MPFDSFRDFVSALDHAGELKRISQPVATELEITEIAVTQFDGEVWMKAIPGKYLAHGRVIVAGDAGAGGHAVQRAHAQAADDGDAQRVFLRS